MCQKLLHHRDANISHGPIFCDKYTLRTKTKKLLICQVLEEREGYKSPLVKGSDTFCLCIYICSPYILISPVQRRINNLSVLPGPVGPLIVKINADSLNFGYN